MVILFQKLKAFLFLEINFQTSHIKHTVPQRIRRQNLLIILLNYYNFLGFYWKVILNISILSIMLNKVLVLLCLNEKSLVRIYQSLYSRLFFYLFSLFILILFFYSFIVIIFYSFYILFLFCIYLLTIIYLKFLFLASTWLSTSFANLVSSSFIF